MIRDREAVVDSALRYAGLGWRIYPIQPPAIDGGWCSCRKGEDCPDPGKHPFHDLGGLKSATTDKQTLKTLFGSSDASIGLLCEKRFWVLDVDGPEGVADLDRLISENEALPQTPTAETGSGGRHYYFAFDKRVKKNRSKIGGCSIDCKTTGGAVVAPPSRHSSGKCYRWLIDPSEADFADAPEWLIDFVTQDDRKSGSQTEFNFAGDLDLVTAPGVGEGERNSQLCRLVGSHLARLGDTPELLQLAIAWGGRCDPPMKESEVSKTVCNLVAKHLANSSDEEDQEQPHGAELSVSRFSEIESREIAWLWEGRFALGKITLLTGEGGVGKSMLTCDLAARISKGISFPDGLSCPIGDVFFIAGEDGAEDTIRPRLDAAGADVDRVHLIRGPIPKGEKYASTLHMGKLDRLLERYPESKLLIIDPIMDYLGAATNSDKATDVRRVLSPLRSLAEKHNIAIVAMNHLNKRQGGHSKGRSLGSGAFVHVARIELRVVEDPEDADRRLLLPVKNNLSAAPGLAFRIESGPNKAGFAVWEEGTVSTTIGEVESDEGGDDRSALQEAVDWLRAFLSEGEVQASEAKKKSRADGIAERTLKRAKKKLRVVTFQKDRSWWWKLPGDTTNNPEECEEESETSFTF
jgi:Bifunctional DNA primase/polymerase, N-terminal/AAA domain